MNEDRIAKLVAEVKAQKQRSKERKAATMRKVKAKRQAAQYAAKVRLKGNPKKRSKKIKAKDQIFHVDCLCGTTFVSVRKGVKYCPSCRDNGRRLLETTANLSPDQRRRMSIIARRHHDYAGRLAKFGIEPGHTQDEWMGLLKSQNYRCHYCRRDLEFYTWSRDHKIPLSRGGSDEISNIVACCRSCNCKKGTKTDFEFINNLPRKKTVVVTAEPLFSQAMTMPSLSVTKSETYASLNLRKTVEREISIFEARANLL